MKRLGSWALARLGENSTYRGLVLVASAFGIYIDPAHIEVFTALGMSLSGAINILRAEKK